MKFINNATVGVRKNICRGQLITSECDVCTCRRCVDARVGFTYLDCPVDILTAPKWRKSSVYAGVTWVTFYPDITLNGADRTSVPDC